MSRIQTIDCKVSARSLRLLLNADVTAGEIAKHQPGLGLAEGLGSLRFWRTHQTLASFARTLIQKFWCVGGSHFYLA